MKPPKGGSMGIKLCGRRCRNLYLYETIVHPRADSSEVEFRFRCATCGAEHLGRLDEDLIEHILVSKKGMANNVAPPSCPL